jgi:hypothetical protein
MATDRDGRASAAYQGTAIGRQLPRFCPTLHEKVAPGGIEPPHADSKSAALSTELRGRRRQGSPVSTPQPVEIGLPDATKAPATRLSEASNSRYLVLLVARSLLRASPPPVAADHLRARGLEPPRACAHRVLNPARLPVPPHPRGAPRVAPSQPRSRWNQPDERE